MNLIIRYQISQFITQTSSQPAQQRLCHKHSAPVRVWACENEGPIDPKKNSMADQISAAHLHASLVDKLAATHVQVDDTSGPFLPACLKSPSSVIFPPDDPPARLIVSAAHPTGGCGQSFAVLVVSAQFNGLSSLQRHRAVNAALREEIARIHAWNITCKTPEEWAEATTGRGKEGTRTVEDEEGKRELGSVAGRAEGERGDGLGEGGKAED